MANLIFGCMDNTGSLHHSLCVCRRALAPRGGSIPNIQLHISRTTVDDPTKFKNICYSILLKQLRQTIIIDCLCKIGWFRLKMSSKIMVLVQIGAKEITRQNPPIWNPHNIWTQLFKQSCKSKLFMNLNTHKNGTLSFSFNFSLALII